MIFISVLVSVGFGYLFFRITRPKEQSGSKSVFYARTFLAWSLFVSTSFYIQPFAAGPGLDTLSFWAVRSIPFAIVAFLVGFIYGKYKELI